MAEFKWNINEIRGVDVDESYTKKLGDLPAHYSLSNPFRYCPIDLQHSTNSEILSSPKWPSRESIFSNSSKNSYGNIYDYYSRENQSNDASKNFYLLKSLLSSNVEGNKCDPYEVTNVKIDQSKVDIYSPYVFNNPTKELEASDYSRYVSTQIKNDRPNVICAQQTIISQSKDSSKKEECNPCNPMKNDCPNVIYSRQTIISQSNDSNKKEECYLYNPMKNYPNVICAQQTIISQTNDSKKKEEDNSYNPMKNAYPNVICAQQTIISQANDSNKKVEDTSNNPVKNDYPSVICAQRTIINQSKDANKKEEDNSYNPMKNAYPNVICDQRTVISQLNDSNKKEECNPYNLMKNDYPKVICAQQTVIGQLNDLNKTVEDTSYNPMKNDHPKVICAQQTIISQSNDGNKKNEEDSSYNPMKNDYPNVICDQRTIISQSNDSNKKEEFYSYNQMKNDYPTVICAQQTIISQTNDSNKEEECNSYNTKKNNHPKVMCARQTIISQPSDPIEEAYYSYNPIFPKNEFDVNNYNDYCSSNFTGNDQSDYSEGIIQSINEVDVNYISSDEESYKDSSVILSTSLSCDDGDRPYTEDDDTNSNSVKYSYVSSAGSTVHLGYGKTDNMALISYTEVKSISDTAETLEKDQKSSLSYSYTEVNITNNSSQGDISPTGEKGYSVNPIKKRRRRRGTYVYNPKPIIEKSKVTIEIRKTGEDEEYKEMRCRNNEAAKRSRHSRREKEMEIVARERSLQEMNVTLKQKLDDLQKKNEYLESLILRKFK